MNTTSELILVSSFSLFILQYGAKLWDFLKIHLFFFFKLLTMLRPKHLNVEV